MFIAFYIIVVLLQFSIGQESIPYESETPKDVDTLPTPNEKTDDFITYIEPMSFGNDYSIDGNVPDNFDNFEDEYVREIELKPVFAEPVEQEQITATNYETEDSTGPQNEEIEPDEVDSGAEDIPKNTVTVSAPVKAAGKATIIAHFGCEDDNNSFSSSEEVPETISFNGCARAQGKVTIAAHFGCGENTGSTVTLPEMDSNASDEISDESVIFGGPVHAQGKVVMGSHYGCGAPIGMPPVFFPWFPPFFLPQIYYPAYPIPGFVAQYPLLNPGPGPLKFQDRANEPGNQDLSDLPVARNLGNSVATDMPGMTFNGVVPASGTVSIAARF